MSAIISRTLLVVLALFLFSELFLPTQSLVSDNQDIYLNNDLVSLDASTEENGNTIVITLTTREILVSDSIFSVDVRQLDVFIDADQDPSRGNAGLGYPMGFEYKVSCFLIGGGATSNNCNLMPIHMQQDPVPLSRINGASDVAQGNTLTIRLPRQVLQVLDDQGQSVLPQSAGIDLFAIAYSPTLGYTLDRTLYGNVDRAPETGVLDSATGQVVLRRTDLLNFDSTFADEVGDVLDSTQDILSLSVSAVDDQLVIRVKYGSPVQLSSFSGITGAILLDTDTFLFTGNFRRGSQVPTWGIDYILYFYISLSDQLISLIHASATTGTQAQNSRTFGPPFNDGRWLIQNDELIFIGSISIFDPFFKINDVEGLFSLQAPANPLYFRVFTNGHISAQISNEDVLTNNQPDLVPSEPFSMIDFTSQNLQALPPIPFPDEVNSVDDPADAVENPAFDIIRVEDAIVGGPTVDSPHILFRVLLSGWHNDETNNEFEIFIDVDNNPQTGMFQITNPDSNIALGAEFRLIAFTQPEVFSVSNPNPNGGDPVSSNTVGYHLQIQIPNQERELYEFHDSMFFPFPQSAPGDVPHFVVAVPVWLLASPEGVLPASVSAYVTAGPLRLRVDIAPPQPLQIALPQQQKRDDVSLLRERRNRFFSRPFHDQRKTNK